jgi:hypothetical protein
MEFMASTSLMARESLYVEASSLTLRAYDFLVSFLMIYNILEKLPFPSTPIYLNVFS